MGVDLGAIFNEVNTIASLTKTKVGGTLVHGASALPKNVPPEQLSWPGHKKYVDEPPPGLLYHHDSFGSRHHLFGISPTHVRLVGSWEYGGNHEGVGLFLKNFDLELSVDSIGSGHSLSISGFFDDPTLVGDPKSPVAEVTAHLTLEHYYVRSLENTFHWVVTVKGDGGLERKQL